MMTSREFIAELKNFRRELHRHPELSGQEKDTPARLLAYTEPSQPDKILKNLGGNSLVLIFDSGKEGPGVLFRADTDALPVKENTDLPWNSVKKEVSHKCGHDGHMAILSGLAHMIGRNRPDKGKAILLFQAEEETGTGAEKVVNDPAFRDIQPDMAFALHNLPGYEKASVIVRSGGFAAASTGVIISFKGKPTHAGHPENGINPANAIADLVKFIEKKLPAQGYHGFALATIIGIRLGERAFGTAASESEFMVTLRSVLNEDLLLMKKTLQEEVEKIASAEGLFHEISYTEEFPATLNDSECVRLVEKAAEESGSKVIVPSENFRWSEDFGHYAKLCPSVLFGLGAGTNSPQLHNEDYDFPDDIISTGIDMFYNIYRRILKK